MQAALLSGPYWVMHHYGITLDRDPNWVAFWLTLLGVTLPVALSAGLVYRMGRQFELRRPLRGVLGLIVVLGSGLISYSTVLNAHAPAAALLIASATCLLHVIRHTSPGRGRGGWGSPGCAPPSRGHRPAGMRVPGAVPAGDFRVPLARGQPRCGRGDVRGRHSRSRFSCTPASCSPSPATCARHAAPGIGPGPEWKAETGKHGRKADAGKELDR